MAERLGLGTLFGYVVAGAPETFNPIAQIASVQPPQPEREVVNVDDLNPTNEVQKKLLGAIDVGEVTLTLNFDDADSEHTGLETDFYNGTEKEYGIKLPSGKGWKFKAKISGWAPQEVGANDVIQAQVTLTVTNKPTFTTLP